MKIIRKLIGIKIIINNNNNLKFYFILYMYIYIYSNTKYLNSLYKNINKNIYSLYGIRSNPELDEEIKFDKHVVLPQTIIQDAPNINNSIKQNVMIKKKKKF